MNQTGLKLFVAAFFATTLVNTACADEQKAARLLIIDAFKLTRQALEIRAKQQNPDEPEAIDIFKEARAKLQSVVNNYPTTDEGMLLAMDGSVHGLSIAALDQAIENETRRINEENSRIGCFSGTIDVNDPRCTQHKPSIAWELIEKGQIKEGMEIFRTVEPTHRALRLLRMSVDNFVEDKNYPLAMQILQEGHTLGTAKGVSPQDIEILTGGSDQIIFDLVRAGDFDEATKYASEFPAEKSRKRARRIIEDYKRRQ